MCIRIDTGEKLNTLLLFKLFLENRILSLTGRHNFLPATIQKHNKIKILKIGTNFAFRNDVTAQRFCTDMRRTV